MWQYVEHQNRTGDLHIRHDNDDHVPTEIRRQVLGERHDVSFSKS